MGFQVLTLLVALVALTDWPTVVKPTVKQVVRLEIQTDSGKGTCSGVVFNVEHGFALTAAHCVDHKRSENIDITLNGRDAEMIRINRLLDLAVVRFNPKDETAMELAEVMPEAGTEIAVVGYAFGIKDPIPQFGRVSQPLNPETGFAWLNVDLIFGDSGGAAIDAQGRLVGINSAIYHQGPAHMAAIVPIEKVRDFVKGMIPVKPAVK